jgi:hypothetical protein
MAGAVTQGESFADIKKRSTGKTMTIDELEAILKEDNKPVKIHPDGTVSPWADEADSAYSEQPVPK